jgi:hypothetical protein
MFRFRDDGEIPLVPEALTLLQVYRLIHLSASLTNLDESASRIQLAC